MKDIHDKTKQSSHAISIGNRQSESLSVDNVWHCGVKTFKKGLF